VGAGTGPCAGVAEANREERKGRVVGGGFARWGAGVEVAEVEGEAEAKRVSRVTLPLEGVEAGEAVGMSLSFENNLSISDPVPLMVTGAPLVFSGSVTVAASRGGVVLAPGELASVGTGCSRGGGGRSRLYGYASPLRTKAISRSIVSASGSCCSDSEPKNQNMTVSGRPLSGFSLSKYRQLVRGSLAEGARRRASVQLSVSAGGAGLAMARRLAVNSG
jgi:hypothetical protein